MSLINQVLQDVEKRQAGDVQSGWAGQVRPVLMPLSDQRQSWLKYALCLLCLVVLAVGIVQLSPVWLPWASDRMVFFYTNPASRSLSLETSLPSMAHQNPTTNAHTSVASMRVWDGLARTLSANWQSETQPTLKSSLSGSADAITASTPIPQDYSRLEQTSFALKDTQMSMADPVQKSVKPDTMTSQTSAVDQGTVSKQIKPDQEVNVLIQRAVDQAQKGRMSEALMLLRQAVISDPQAEDARQLLAGYLFEEKQDTEAVAMLRAGLKSYPEQHGLAKTLARWQLSHGQPEAVMESLKPVLSLSGQDAETHWMFAMASQQIGQHAQALSYFERAIHLQPGHAQWYVAYALSLQAVGQLNQALQQFEMAQNLPLSERMSEFVTQQIRQLRGGRTDSQ